MTQSAELEVHCSAFRSLLGGATAAIEPPYFLLPIDGGDSVYRERVYCYELYHQLKSHWLTDLANYQLGGEVDKSGHELMNSLGARGSPDLLVHYSGDMTKNLVIIEVKPAIRVDNINLDNDLSKLQAFTTRAQYKLGIYLIYGGEKHHIQRIQAMMVDWKGPERALNNVELWWHEQARKPALIYHH